MGSRSPSSIDYSPLVDSRVVVDNLLVYKWLVRAEQQLMKFGFIQPATKPHGLRFGSATVDTASSIATHDSSELR